MDAAGSLRGGISQRESVVQRQQVSAMVHTGRFVGVRVRRAGAPLPRFSRALALHARCCGTCPGSASRHARPAACARDDAATAAVVARASPERLHAASYALPLPATLRGGQPLAPVSVLAGVATGRGHAMRRRRL